MVSLSAAVCARLAPAFDAVEPGADPVLRPSNRVGVDFQANGALPLAKRIGVHPAELAAKLVAQASLGEICDKIEVSERGFVNLRLSEAFISRSLLRSAADPRLGVAPSSTPRRVVVDYSGPNIAKEMHVGHVRSTVIGDALCRMLVFRGEDVVRENHVGDWGTPFGMLIEHLVDLGEQVGAAELSVGDLGEFYSQARSKFDASPGFAERSRRRVVALQAGDGETIRLWRVLVERSEEYFSAVFERFGVLLGQDDVVGESFYNDMLPSVVAELEEAGLLVESEGALCVFPPGWTNRDGEPLPLIVRKSDGGYGYAATDLAALRDRFGRLGAGLVLYVTGAPQSQHLEMCFAVAKMAGWVPEEAEAVHVSFGSVLGPDRKMFRTRSGGAVKLGDLLDEAELRARAAVAKKNPDLSDSEAAEVARAVGIGALKYSDLSTDRTRDYVFDWDRMLAFEGNTGPYLQYAHARIRSIFRRGGIDPSASGLAATIPSLGQPAERALGIALLGFEDALVAALGDWSPHKLCGYLFELAGAFTTFYETCPVLGAGDAPTTEGRLLLCELTARTLQQGLELLGIAAPHRM